MGTCEMKARAPDAEPGEPLGRDAIFAVEDRQIIPLEIPEWNGTVFLRVMGGKERDSYENSLVNPATGKLTRRDNYRARFAVLVLCNAEGERLFGDGDVKKLSGKSAKALDRIWDAGTKLNGMTDEDIEEIAGNSESSQSEDSGSD